MPKRPSKDELDPYSAEYYEANVASLEKIPVEVFLCGSALRKSKRVSSRRDHPDIRLFLKSKLEKGLKLCSVKLGEHKKMIQA